MKPYEEKYLKEFYMLHFRLHSMPKFEELHQDQVESIYNLTSFKVFVLRKSFGELGEAIGWYKFKSWIEKKLWKINQLFL